MAAERLVDLTDARIEAWAKVEAQTRPSSARLAMRLLKAFLNWCAAHPNYSTIVTRNAAKSAKAREILGKPKVKYDLLQREQLTAWFGEVRKIGNLREIAAEIGVDGHIDAARIADNFTLRGPGTADGVTQLAKSLMDAAGVVKCRKTAVMALELLFTLPAGTTINLQQYFEQAIGWAERHFGVPVLSCVAHLDEGAPHAHALLLPLVDGRMGGSDLHGGKAKLWAMQTSFHDEVGSHYGLARQAAQKRLSAPVRTAAIELARASLQANSALTDTIVDALLLPHAKDPGPLLRALGIDMPASKAKAKPSFVAMMTAPCKPEPRNPIGKANRNPIGIVAVDTAPKSQPYTCVGIAFPTAPIPHDFHHRHAAADTFVSHSATEEGNSTASLPEAGAQRNEVQRSTTTSTSADQRQPVNTLRNFAEAPAPSATGLTTNTSDESAKRARAAVLLAPLAGGVRIISDTLQDAQFLDTPTTDDAQHQGDTRSAPSAQDVNSSSGISPAVNIASRPPEISGGYDDHREHSAIPAIDKTKATNFVGLAEPHVAGAAALAYALGEVQIPHPIEGPALDAVGNYQRQHDDDHPAECWDCEHGEFISTTGPPPARVLCRSASHQT